MKRIFTFLLIAAFCFSSCTGDKPGIPDPGTGETEQTLLIYMPWSSNLTSYFLNNLKDFESAIERGILGNNKVLVFFMSSPSEAELFEFEYSKGECTRGVRKNYKDPAFTTAEGITSILNDVKTFAPAERYSLIVSCHGMGWLPVYPSTPRTFSDKAHWEYEGVPLTRFFGGLTSEYQTDITTLAEGISGAGIKMEYILFDDCYMSCVEVAYDLKEVTNYLIGCPTEIMAHGMPYDIIADYLVGKADYANICNGFVTFYRNYSRMPCGTIGVTDCSQIDQLAAVMKEINRSFIFDPSLEEDVQRMCGYRPTIFFDYGDYISKLCRDAVLLEKFRRQLVKTVPYKANTDTYYSMSGGRVPIGTFSGVTVSDLSSHTRAEDKTETAWYKATH